MKKLITLLLGVFMMMGITACGQSQTEKTEDTSSVVEEKPEPIMQPKAVMPGMGVPDSTLSAAPIIPESVLEEEKVIGIFPEGTFKEEIDGLLPFKIGAVKMAHDAKSVIVPMAIVGKFRPFRKGLTLVYGKPYKIKSNDLDMENDKLKRKIQELIDEERGK